MFEKAYCEYRLNRVESALKTIEAAPEQTDKLKELYGQVVRQIYFCTTPFLDCIDGGGPYFSTRGVVFMHYTLSAK